MPRTVNKSIENNFLKGLITENTALNFPENACTETYNCVFDERARVSRRPSIDFEAGYTTKTINRTSSVVSGFTWYNVAGDGTVSLRVQQVGDILYFWNILSSSTAVSQGALSSNIDLNTYAVSGSVDPALNECQYASGNGYLFVVHPECDPIYVTYDTAAATVSATRITLQIRDFEGLNDTYETTFRPTSTVAGLSKEHKYNLFNQGWYFNSNAALTAWDTAFTTMPSNADIWWMYKNTNNAFDTATVANTDPGNSPAPKGHYILDVFNLDRTTASGVASITTVTLAKRPSTTAFLGGRVFYSGILASNYSSRLYFSNILEKVTTAGQCYQQNDPTSEDLPDITAADGGVITIFGTETIIKLWPLVNVLLVFATNGIWAITGGEGLGFRANDYTITKISSIPAISASSFIDLDGYPMWWNQDGIYLLTPGQGGGFDVNSLTDSTIKQFFNDIPVGSKRLARGAYNSLNKTVRWMYKTTTSSDPTLDYQFDGELSYNLLTQAFYPWTFTSTNPVQIQDIFVVKGTGGVQAQLNVLRDNGDTVQNDALADVIIFSLQSTIIEPEYKYTCSYAIAGPSYNFTFGSEVPERRKDWFSYDSVGVNYSSYFITGYKVHADASKYFQSNYVWVFLEQEDTSSCLMRGIWDWTTSASTHRWSSQQQIYKTSLANSTFNHKRLKVRGKGKSLQLRFDSVDDLPFTIVGWSIFETANAGP